MTNPKRLLPSKIANLAVTLLIGTGLLILLSLSLLFWVSPVHAEADVMFKCRGLDKPQCMGLQSNNFTPPTVPGTSKLAASNPITLAINSLPAGKELKIVFASVITDPFTDLSLQVENQGSISGSNLTADVLTDDPDTPTADDPTITNITLQADFGIVKSVSPATLKAGDLLTYTLTFSNATGAGVNVTITDIIPVSITVQNVAASGVAVAQSNVGHTYTWTTSLMTSGQSGIITITGQMTDTIALTTTINNSVEITTTSKDINIANNSSNVDVTVTPTGNCYATPDNGTTVYRSSAAQAVRLAVADAAANGTVKVAGYCAGVQSRNSLTQTVYISKSLTLQGGYISSNWSISNPVANPTTLDAQNSGRVLVIVDSITVTLENLDITGGDAALGDGTLDAAGGGIYAITATTIISNSRVFSNIASNGGGLYFNGNSNVTLTANTIDNNRAGPLAGGGGTGGAAYFINNTNPTLTGNLINDNGATNAGGLYFYNSDAAMLTSNVISNNTANHIGGGVKHYGGVLFFSSDNATLISNTIQYNWAANRCGGLCFTNSANARLTNNTVYSNSTGFGGFTVSEGGGIHIVVNSSVTLISNTITYNSSTTSGGGLYLNTNSTATLSNTVVNSNSAKFSGGGIFNEGGSSVTLTSTTVSRNTASLSSGGGIYNTGSGSVVNMTNTTVSSNKAITNGGGIFNTSSGSVVMVNTTVSSNEAITNGGGIFNDSGSVVMTNTTVSSNTASTGGGIRNQSSGSITIRNSIIANSTSGGNCSNTATLTSNGYNLSSDGSCTDFTTIGDQQNINPRLGPLADNGGPTAGVNGEQPMLTHALLSNSPALEGAVCVSGLTTDQRGFSRPDPAPLCDIGAYESTEAAVRDLVITKSGPATVVASEYLTYTLTFSNAGIGIAQNVVITDEIPLTLTNVTVISSGVTITDTAYSPVYVWNIQDLAVNQTGIITVSALVTSGTPAGTLINTAIVSTTSTDGDIVNNSSTVTTTINTEADLEIGKTATPNLAIAGELLTYTLTITNNGPSDAQTVLVTDTLPSGVTFAWTVACGGMGSGYPTCPLNTITANTTISYQIVVTVNASSSGNITNGATATSSTIDPSSSNNVISQTTAINAAADLEIGKTSWPEPVVAGEQLTYTLTISNNGPSDIAIPVTITDSLDNGVTFDNASGSCGHNAGTVTCTVASLTANNSVTRTIVVTVNSNVQGTITNTAIVSDSNLIDLNNSNNSITQTSTITTSADLVITKSDFPDPVSAGQTLTYTVMVTNNGPSDAQSVLVTDTLPTGVSFNGTSGDCSNNPTGVPTCNLNTITAGLSKQYVITVTVYPTTTGSVDNVLTITSSTTDPGPGANSDPESTTINVIADLEINKIVADNLLDPGQRITYTLTFTNNGPSTASGVVITDQVPISLSNISASNSGANIVPTGSFSYVWNVDDLNPGATGTITISGDVTTTLTGAASFTNTAEITGSNSDSNITNNSSSVKVSVSEAQVEIGKFVNNATPGPGETITYTIIITNNGPAPATGLVLSDTLPLSVTFQTAISTGGTYNENTGVWSGLPSLGVGNWHILTLTVVVTDVSGTLGNSIVNTALITEVTEIDNSSNNTASVTINVKGAELQIGKTVANSTPSESGTIVYTVVVTNAGPDATTGVVISDSLPLSVTFVSSYTTQGLYDNSSGLWSLGAINGGNSTATLRITATLDAGTAGQSITNVTVISASALADLDSSNDVATATLTVKDADLSMSKSVTPTSVREGQTIVYTLIVTNAGPASTSNIIISDTLPAGVTFGSQSGTGSYDDSSGAWSVGTTLNSSDRATMTITATVNSGTASQTITNTATISAAADGDTNSNNNSASAAFSVQESDLDLAKFITGSDDGSQLLKLTSADTGQQITYTLVITNEGPHTLPAGSVVSDTLPSSLTIIAPSAVSGTITNTSNLVTWNLPQLAINEVTTATITATVNAGSASQIITNTASINSATQGDTITTNNSSTATLTINGADLQIGKSVTPVSPLEGDTITYTIVVTNIAGDTSPNIVISDVLPTGITYGALVSGSPSQGSYTAGSIGVWSGITLTLNSTASLVFTATVDGSTGGNTLVNTTAISSSNTEDPDTSNNTASASVTVATFDLEISKSSIRNDEAITYTLTVSNSGSTTAPGAVISDAVPSGMLGNTWNWTCVASGATCPNAAGSGDINETSGSIPVNGQLTYNITATLVISTATMTNTATVTSLNGLGDSDSGNNSATDISAVTSGGIYLPIICKAGCLNLTVIDSDLIIVPCSLVASSSSISLQIQNVGSTATSNDFWVDVYFNPSQTPTINKTWQSIASSGAAWGVTQSLAAGETVTLTVGGTYYDASKSSSSFPLGATVYAYVDSVNYATTYGAVLETNENNNLSSPVNSTAGAAGPIPGGSGSISSGSLPQR